MTLDADRLRTAAARLRSGTSPPALNPRRGGLFYERFLPAHNCAWDYPYTPAPWLVPTNGQHVFAPKSEWRWIWTLESAP